MTEEQRQLVEQHVDVARRIAGRFRRWLDDADEVALLGLVLAANRYRPDAGPFLSFAVPTIRGELKRAARDHSRSVRLPRAVHDGLMAIRPLVAELQQRLGREPTIGELVIESGLDESLVIECLAAWAGGVEELDVDGHVDGQVADDHSEGAATALTVRSAIDELREVDRRAITQYYFADRTQQEIADGAGVSQMQIHRRIRRGLHHLADSITTGGSEQTG